MEAVLSWVKQIFILSILSTVVTHLMPSAKYTKYASYICGLLIVMVCIQPLAAVFHGGISPDKAGTDVPGRGFCTVCHGSL